MSEALKLLIKAAEHMFNVLPYNHPGGEELERIHEELLGIIERLRSAMKKRKLIK